MRKHNEGTTTASRKPPYRFVVRPGSEDVIAEYAQADIQTKAKAMATTSVMAKTIGPRKDKVYKGMGGNNLEGLETTISSNFGKVSEESNMFVFREGGVWKRG